MKGAIIWCFVHQVILLKPAGITQNLAMDERMRDDVRQLQLFLANQQRLLSEEQFEKLRETQYQSVLKRVGSHRMGWEGINALSELIQTGLWTDEQKAGLGLALGECSVVSSGKTARPNQACADFTPFWSQEDVLVLRGPENSLVSKLEQVAARLVASQHVKPRGFSHTHGSWSDHSSGR